MQLKIMTATDVPAMISKLFSKIFQLNFFFFSVLFFFPFEQSLWPQFSPIVSILPR